MVGPDMDDLSFQILGAMKMLSPLLLAAPVEALLSFLRPASGAPDHGR